MENMIEWLAVAISFGALVFAIFKSHTANSKKIGMQEEKINNHQKVLDEIKKEATEMKRDFAKDIKGVETNFIVMLEKFRAEQKKEIEQVTKRVEEVSFLNREDHGKLFSELGSIGKGVSKIEGYLMGKNEKQD